MPANSVFRWIDGEGWLILAAGTSDAIRAQALGRISADGALAVVHVAGDAEELLADLAGLGAPSGYIVDVITEDDPAITKSLSEAGMIVVTGIDRPRAVRGYLRGAASEGIEQAYARGAVVLLEDTPAMIAGTWVLDDEAASGFEWLEGVAVLPDGVGDHPQVTTLLTEMPTAVVVTIGEGSALCLGPGGQIELWGRRQVTVTLGSAYNA